MESIDYSEAHSQRQLWTFTTLQGSVRILCKLRVLTRNPSAADNGSTGYLDNTIRWFAVYTRTRDKSLLSCEREIAEFSSFLAKGKKWVRVRARPREEGGGGGSRRGGAGCWEKKREPTEARRDRLLRHSCNFPVVSRLVNSRWNMRRGAWCGQHAAALLSSLLAPPSLFIYIYIYIYVYMYICIYIDIPFSLSREHNARPPF